MHTQLTDVELARFVAQDVGRVLVEVQQRGLEGRELMDTGDQAGHQRALELLGQARPDDVIFSEEGQDPIERLSADRCWVVDPLDGTRSYGRTGEAGKDWAVHIALWERGSESPAHLAAGAVAMPPHDSLWTTLDGPKAPAIPQNVSVKTIVRSRTRGPVWLSDVAEKLGVECIPRGSAGVKIMAVVTGQADAYVHSGGQWEWDSAAPAAIALHAGWHVSRLDGTPMAYNQQDPHLPDLLVCHPAHAADLLAAIEPFHCTGVAE